MVPVVESEQELTAVWVVELWIDGVNLICTSLLSVAMLNYGVVVYTIIYIL